MGERRTEAPIYPSKKLQSRTLTVGEAFLSERATTSVPLIRLSGRWLEVAGFHCRDQVEVRVKAGKLTVIRLGSG